MRSLGAAHTVDYTGDIATAIENIAPQGVDKVLNAAGDATALGATRKAGGTLASTRVASAQEVCSIVGRCRQHAVDDYAEEQDQPGDKQRPTPLAVPARQQRDSDNAQHQPDKHRQPLATRRPPAEGNGHGARLGLVAALGGAN